MKKGGTPSDVALHAALVLTSSLLCRAPTYLAGSRLYHAVSPPRLPCRTMPSQTVPGRTARFRATPGLACRYVLRRAAPYLAEPGLLPASPRPLPTQFYITPPKRSVPGLDAPRLPLRSFPNPFRYPLNCRENYRQFR